MKRIAFADLSASFILALALLATSPVQPRGTGAQEPVSLAVDADPSGNTATSLGPIDRCIAVRTGDYIHVDIVVRDVQDLLAWEAYAIYDPSVLKLTDRDVRLFLAGNAGSNVFDASDAPPGTDGRYRVAAADIGDPPAPDSGSGVLARLTLSALSPGVSLISLPRLDFSGDGTPDIGPILTALGGQRIGDSDGDSYFDGPIADAWIAVDTDCPQQPPPLPTVAAFSPEISTPLPVPTRTPAPPATLTPTPLATNADSAGGDGPPWGAIGGVGGGAAVLGAGALLLWQLWARRRA
jgi:hypothetical protein